MSTPAPSNLLSGIINSKSSGSNIFKQCFETIRHLPQYKGRWISADIWASKSPSSSTLPTNSATPTSTASTPPSFLPEDLNYWNSGLAIKTFGLVNPQEDDEDDVTEIIKKRICRLEEAYQSSNGWRLVIDDLDAQDLYSEHDQFCLRWHCRYVAKALTIALEQESETQQPSWEQCCMVAVQTINDFEGFAFITSARTVMDWHLKFRKTGECFANRRVVTKAGKSEHEYSLRISLSREMEQWFSHDFRAQRQCYPEIHTYSKIKRVVQFFPILSYSYLTRLLVR
jgi:hypothetical protein